MFQVLSTLTYDPYVYWQRNPRCHVIVLKHLTTVFIANQTTAFKKEFHLSV